MASRLHRLALAGLPLILLLNACRDGTGEPVTTPVPASTVAATGCNGVNQVFPQVPTEIVPMSITLGASSQMVAAIGSEELFVTGVNATVACLDFSGGPTPVETVIVNPGTVDTLLVAAGIGTPADLSGIAIFDATLLLVVERTSNTILLVERLVPDQVSFFVGFPTEIPGYLDGVAGVTRFAFTSPSQILVGGDGNVYVADPGNHALRLVRPGVLPLVATLAGGGIPGYQDGDFFSTLFDTPTGIALSCVGEVLVTEAGTQGAGGHRLRSLLIGLAGNFGITGITSTLAGSGTEASDEGIGELADLAAPVGLAGTSQGDVYWVDSSTGILRRLDGTTGMVDCPQAADCASAGGFFSATGGGFALSILDIGGTDVLFVLDADQGRLFRITP